MKKAREMKSPLFAVIVSMALLAACFIGGCESDATHGKYGYANGIPADSLLSQAISMLDKGASDSAAVLFSIVGERYENHINAGGKHVSDKEAVQAYTNMSYIFSNFLTDYPKAYDYGQRALEICTEAVKNDTSFRKYLPYIYLNLGVTMIQYDDSRLQGDSVLSENVEYIERAFENGIRCHEWRPSIISFQNLAGLLIQNGDTAELRRIADKYSSCNVPDSISLADYSSAMLDYIDAYVRGDYDSAAEVALSMPGRIGPDPNYESLCYISRWLESEAYMKGGSKDKAESVLSSLANDIEKNGSANTMMWICKIMADHYELASPVNSKEWQLKFYKVKERMDSVSSSSLGYVTDIRKVKESMAQAREEQSRQKVIIVVLISGSIFIILALVGIIFWQRSSRHYRRTIVMKHLSLIDGGISSSSDEETDEIPEDKSPEEDSSLHEISDLLLEKVSAIMNDPAIVTDLDFSLSILCSKVESNTTYVSRAIKKLYGKTFTQLMNEKRVAEACRRLVSEEYDRFTIEAVASQLGFKSRSNFTAVFKKITGLSPSDFRKSGKSLK